MKPTSSCPLCTTPTAVWFRDHWRDYYRCPACSLVHVPPTQHPDPEREKAEYDLHENHPDDPGYRTFLARLTTPLTRRLRSGAAGLDFGCGPAPALAAMLSEEGYSVALHDPFYFPRPDALRDEYDFITATEVLEHLSRPGKELDRLWSLLHPGGWLGVMTRRLPEPEEFAGWHYRRDITHICFFHEDSFRWLARRWSAKLVLEGTDVALLRKP